MQTVIWKTVFGSRHPYPSFFMRRGRSEAAAIPANDVMGAHVSSEMPARRTRHGVDDRLQAERSCSPDTSSKEPARRRFVRRLNCFAIPETLLESDRFGQRKDAFGHARDDRRGLCHAAHRGSMFLDEAGDLVAAFPGKLLRVRREKEVHPLGAASPVPTNVDCDCRAPGSDGARRESAAMSGNP